MSPSWVTKVEEPKKRGILGVTATRYSTHLIKDDMLHIKNEGAEDLILTAAHEEEPKEEIPNSTGLVDLEDSYIANQPVEREDKLDPNNFFHDSEDFRFPSSPVYMEIVGDKVQHYTLEDHGMTRKVKTVLGVYDRVAKETPEGIVTGKLKSSES